MKRRTALPLILSAALPLSGLGAAWAQAQEPWPNRPLTLVVASAAGSGLDVIARETAQRLSLALKQPVLVDNKPGASGVLAGARWRAVSPMGTPGCIATHRLWRSRLRFCAKCLTSPTRS